jgi:hypothetical protein
VAPQFDTAQGWFADLAAPEALESNEGLAALISSQISDLRVSAPWHEYVSVPVSDHLHGALAASPVRLSTMGRGYDRDPLAFLTAAAAGAYAVSLLR